MNQKKESGQGKVKKEICGALRNLVKNTHGGVLILVKLQAEECNFTLKLTLLHGCFSYFFNCTNGTKWRNVPYFLYLSFWYWVSN